MAGIIRPRACVPELPARSQGLRRGRRPRRRTRPPRRRRLLLARGELRDPL